MERIFVARAILIFSLVGAPLLSLQQAKAAPDDCGLLPTSLYVENIVQEHAALLRTRDDVRRLRDVNEGCLIWLGNRKDIYIALVEPESVSSHAICKLRLRSEDGRPITSELLPLKRLTKLGNNSFNAALKKSVKDNFCRAYVLVRSEGRLAAFIDTRGNGSESNWAIVGGSKRIPVTVKFQKDSRTIADLMKLVFEERSQIEAIGPRGLIARGETGKRASLLVNGGFVSKSICLPVGPGVGALTAEEFRLLAGFSFSDWREVAMRIVGDNNDALDIRSVVFACEAR